MLNREDVRRWAFWRRPPRPVKLQGILWPALGYPAVVRPGARFRVVLSVPGSEAPERPRVRAGGAELPVVDAVLAPISSVRGLGHWAPWVMRGAPWVLVVTVAAPEAAAGLLDLEVEGPGWHYAKPACVAVRTAGPELRLLVATDLHLATRWDEHDAGLRAHHAEHPPFEDLTHFTQAEAFSRQTIGNSYVNPNENFRAFLRLVAERAARGEVDALLLHGDLVDFKFNAPRAGGGTGFADTGWKLLHDLLLVAPRLSVPLFTCTGNHDYRLYPYRFRTYGMRHAGLPDEVSAPYLQARGEWGRWQYQPGDLDAVRIDSGAAHSLDYYFREFNPFLDYELALGGARMLVLDSGPDAVTNLNHLWTARRGRFVKGLGNLASPSSDGLRDDQVAYLRHWIAAAPEQTAVVVSHAPLVFPPEEPAHVLRVPEDAPAEAFEESLTQARLDRRGLFGHQLAVFQALRTHPATALFLAGHCHTNAAMRLDRATSDLRHDAAPPGEGQAWVLHTASLGHGHPAFRRLAFREGRLAECAVEPLLLRWSDAWSYDWRQAADAEFIITIRPRGQVTAEECRHRLILHFAGEEPGRLRFHLADADAVEASGAGSDGGGAYACWVVRPAAELHVRVEGWRRLGRVAFLYETVRGAERSGLTWHAHIFR